MLRKKIENRADRLNLRIKAKRKKSHLAGDLGPFGFAQGMLFPFGV